MSKPIESKMTKLSNFVDVIAGLESSNLNQILGQTQQISKRPLQMSRYLKR